jgi:hypothetical protein
VDPLDRELASLLSIEPSPEFRARVRVRIASEPALRVWLPRWSAVVAGVTVVLVAAALVVGRSQLTDRTRRDLALAGPPSVASGLSRTIESPPQAVAATPMSSGQQSNGRRRERTAAKVLVAASEVRGLRQLTAIVREGRLQFAFSNEPALDTAIEPARDMVVAPLAIAPIEIPTISDVGEIALGDNP